ncbi:hypothetical protein H6G98_01970 [Nostoc sp. FACHB-857]|nr:hypothetical protein [Nostoc sp. FACHB-857]
MGHRCRGYRLWEVWGVWGDGEVWEEREFMPSSLPTPPTPPTPPTLLFGQCPMPHAPCPKTNLCKNIKLKKL